MNECIHYHLVLLVLFHVDAEYVFPYGEIIRLISNEAFGDIRRLDISLVILFLFNCAYSGRRNIELARGLSPFLFC